jgi:NAD(P)-dependent dehydrogenase (short-subunit alcohol dehydrogenase family)
MTDKLFDFTGKVALITGGSRGLGKEMALALAERGASVIVASRKAEACVEVAEQIEAMGGQALAYGCHVGDWDAIQRLVDAAYERFGKVDILINNAGMSPLYEKVSDVTEALFQKVIDVNLGGPYRLMALIGEKMMEGDGGSIINISSTASQNPTPNAEPYGAAKSGLNNLSRSFAYAFGPKVRVNSIAAGPFLTDISNAWDMEQFEERAKDRIALQRGGQPDEIVGAVLFLAGDAGSFTTGGVIRVDGGAH